MFMGSSLSNINQRIESISGHQTSLQFLSAGGDQNLMTANAEGFIMQETIWVSPTEYVTGDASLEISYPFAGHPNTIVTSKTPGDLKWFSMGLRLPQNVSIEDIIICYQVSNKRSFISQVRLSEMGAPDQATHDTSRSVELPHLSCPRHSRIG
jgi:hypothetical protein